MRMTRLPAAAITLVLALSGCGIVRIEETDPNGRQSSGGGSSAATSSADLVGRSLRDVERFWKQTYPQIAGGATFKTVQGGFHPYTETDPPPACGGQQASYEPNAFYCPQDDFIAWDAQTLIPQLRKNFGDLLAGVVMAHEYGHAVQARLGRTEQPTVVLEQQADCFAGAWTADVLAGNSDVFGKITPAQLDDTVAGLLMLRDQPGVAAQSEGAHGNAFDRIRAYQDGVEDGAKKCVTYAADNLPVTEIPFSTDAEAASGGDLQYDRAVTALSEDAQSYWTRTFPQLATGQTWQPVQVTPFRAGSPPDCAAPDATAEGSAFFCPDRDYVAFDNDRLGQALYEQIGDFAVGMLLGELFARAAQDRRGQPTRDQAGQLAVDCLSGSWTNDLLRRNSDADLRLSPGDLDEAVSALLAFGRAENGSGPTAFQRIASYRKGALNGLSACA